MTLHRRPMFWLIAAALCLMAGIVIPRLFVRDRYEFPPRTWSDFRVAVSDRRVWFSWPVQSGYRGWAGQTNRYGVRYNRYSDGSGNVSMPSAYLTPPLGLVVIGCAYQARRLYR